MESKKISLLFYEETDLVNKMCSIFYLKYSIVSVNKMLVGIRIILPDFNVRKFFPQAIFLLLLLSAGGYALLSRNLILSYKGIA